MGDEEFKMIIIELWKEGDTYSLDEESTLPFVQELMKRISGEHFCKKLGISEDMFKLWLGGDNFIKEDSIIAKYLRRVIGEFQLNVCF